MVLYYKIFFLRWSKRSSKIHFREDLKISCNSTTFWVLLLRCSPSHTLLETWKDHAIYILDLLKIFYLQIRPNYNIPNYDIKSVLYCQTHCIQQTINQFWTIRTSKHSSWKMVFCYYYIACPFGANSHLLFTTTTRHTQLLAVADIHTYNKSRAPKTSNPPS